MKKPHEWMLAHGYEPVGTTDGIYRKGEQGIDGVYKKPSITMTEAKV